MAPHTPRPPRRPVAPSRPDPLLRAADADAAIRTLGRDLVGLVFPPPSPSSPAPLAKARSGGSGSGSGSGGASGTAGTSGTSGGGMRPHRYLRRVRKMIAGKLRWAYTYLWPKGRQPRPHVPGDPQAEARLEKHRGFLRGALRSFWDLAKDALDRAERKAARKAAPESGPGSAPEPRERDADEDARRSPEVAPGSAVPVADAREDAPAGDAAEAPSRAPAPERTPRERPPVWTLAQVEHRRRELLALCDWMERHDKANSAEWHQAQHELAELGDRIVALHAATGEKHPEEPPTHDPENEARREKAKREAKEAKEREAREARERAAKEAKEREAQAAKEAAARAEQDALSAAEQRQREEAAQASADARRKADETPPPPPPAPEPAAAAAAPAPAPVESAAPDAEDDPEAVDPAPPPIDPNAPEPKWFTVGPAADYEWHGEHTFPGDRGMMAGWTVAIRKRRGLDEHHPEPGWYRIEHRVNNPYLREVFRQDEDYPEGWVAIGSDRSGMRFSVLPSGHERTQRRIPVMYATREEAERAIALHERGEHLPLKYTADNDPERLKWTPGENPAVEWRGARTDDGHGWYSITQMDAGERGKRFALAFHATHSDDQGRHVSTHETAEQARSAADNDERKRLVRAGDEHIADQIAQSAPAPRVVSISAERLGAFGAAIDALNKRARRLGVPEILWEEVPGSRRTETVELKEDGSFFRRGASVKLTRVVCDVRLIGDPPVVAGWKFVGTLDPQPGGGAFIRGVPGEEIPEHIRMDANTGRCDHCKTKRERKSTFVLRRQSDGKHAIIGRSCLKDYLGGNSPDKAAAALSLWTEANRLLNKLLDDDKEDRDDMSMGRRPPTAADLPKYMAHVAQSVRENGWTSRAAAADFDDYSIAMGRVIRTATADDALARAFPDFRRKSPNEFTEKDWAYHTPEEADHATAKAVLEWAKKKYGDAANTDLDNYGHNIAVILRNGYVDQKTAGVAASIVRGYQRDVSDKLSKQRGDAAGHFGQPGERTTAAVTVLDTKVIEGIYGTRTLVTMETADGHRLKWWATGDAPEGFEQGAKLNVKLTVKDHGEYKGAKETTVSRVALAKDAPAGKPGKAGKREAAATAKLNEQAEEAKRIAEAAAPVPVESAPAPAPEPAAAEPEGTPAPAPEDALPPPPDTLPPRAAAAEMTPAAQAEEAKAADAVVATEKKVAEAEEAAARKSRSAFGEVGRPQPPAPVPDAAAVIARVEALTAEHERAAKSSSTPRRAREWRQLGEAGRSVIAAMRAVPAGDARWAALAAAVDVAERRPADIVALKDVAKPTGADGFAAARLAAKQDPDRHASMSGSVFGLSDGDARAIQDKLEAAAQRQAAEREAAAAVAKLAAQAEEAKRIAGAASGAHREAQAAHADGAISAAQKAATAPDPDEAARRAALDAVGKLRELTGEAQRVADAAAGGGAGKGGEKPKRPPLSRAVFSVGVEGRYKGAGRRPPYSKGDVVLGTDGHAYKVVSTHSQYTEDGRSFGFDFDDGWTHAISAVPAGDKETARLTKDLADYEAARKAHKEATARDAEEKRTAMASVEATFGKWQRMPLYKPPANAETIHAGGKDLYEIGGTYRVVIGGDTVDVIKDGGDYGDSGWSAPRNDETERVAREFARINARPEPVFNAPPPPPRYRMYPAEGTPEAAEEQKRAQEAMRREDEARKRRSEEEDRRIIAAAKDGKYTLPAAGKKMRPRDAIMAPEGTIIYREPDKYAQAKNRFFSGFQRRGDAWIPISRPEGRERWSAEPGSSTPVSLSGLKYRANPESLIDSDSETSFFVGGVLPPIKTEKEHQDAAVEEARRTPYTLPAKGSPATPRDALLAPDGTMLIRDFDKPHDGYTARQAFVRDGGRWAPMKQWRPGDPWTTDTYNAPMSPLGLSEQDDLARYGVSKAEPAAPAKPPAAAPRPASPSPSPPPSARSGADAEYGDLGGGLSARLAKTGDKVGITGNTYEFREAIKSAGGKWDSNLKVWFVPVSKWPKAAAALRRATAAATRKGLIGTGPLSPAARLRSAIARIGGALGALHGKV